MVAAFRLPIRDSVVWSEALAAAGSIVALLVAMWWLTGRAGVSDRYVVLSWGIASGLALGSLWLAEIAFNNLTPHSISTAAARGVLDNATWAAVAIGTVGATAGATARTGRCCGRACGRASAAAWVRPWAEPCCSRSFDRRSRTIRS